MKNKSIDCDTISKIYDIYNRKNILLDENYLIPQYISTNETLRHHIIINNRNVIGALFIGSDSKFHIISLSHTEMDRYIYGTVETSPI